MDDRLTELQQKRLRRRRKQQIIRFALLGVLGFLLAFNIAFLILNLRQAKKVSEAAKALSEQESKYDPDVVPIRFDLDTEEAPTEEPETTVPEETEPADPYQEDPRYECVRAFNNFGFMLPDKILQEVYEEPSQDARVIGRARKFSGVEVLEETSYFYHISYENCDGYVPKSSVRTGEEAEALALEYCHSICEIVTDGEPIYKEPTDTSEAVCFAQAGKYFTIMQYLGDWYKIDNTIYAGYVRQDRVKNNRFLDDTYFFQKPGEKISDLRLQVVDYAFEWFGTPYVWGGETLGEGVDCSAYVWRIFQKFDIPMPRLSAEQAEWGEPVASMDEILPGDLLFYRGYNDAEESWTEGVGHVGIYIGNGRMIHAASVARGITVDDYNFLEEPMCIRRVIED